MSQLTFNPDGSICLPESIEKSFEKQRFEKEKSSKLESSHVSIEEKDKEKKLDIWEKDNLEDETYYHLEEDVSGFNLYNQEGRLNPLRFSNGKTQGDVVKEVVNEIENGKRVIFIRGVCGTGKCLEKNTRILCKPEEEKYFGYYRISNLIGRKGKILSVNSKGEIIETKFLNVRETGKKKLYKLKTRTGREIIASENHPFLTITEKGFEWLSLNELNETSYICIPNKVSLEQRDDLNDDEIKILAHLIAEGKLGDVSGSPIYFQNSKINPLIRRDYENALKNVFPDGEIKSYSEEDVAIIFRNMDTRFGTTNKLRLFIRKFGLDGKKSAEKFVPKIIFNLTNNKISLFLKTLFSCDGSIYLKKSKNLKRQPVIEYCSISKILIGDISFLLNRFGIQHTITSKKFKENLNYSYRIIIYNQTNLKKFIEKIGFIGRKQKIALDIYSKLNNFEFTNIDKVPRVIRNYFHNKGYSYNELDRFLNYKEIEELRKFTGFKKLLADKSIKTPRVFKQGKIDFLRKYLIEINKHITDDTLSFICSEDIMWDKIKSIDYLKNDRTYDLEVLEHHNFIANGIIVHNSAIALNIAKQLGNASIVVPGKSLQKQYWKDYSHDCYVLKSNHQKLKIKVITGRANHRCLYKNNSTADDSEIPCKIEIREKNMYKLSKYLKENPKIKNDLELKNIRRNSIAPVCPYWSPIVPSEFDLNLSAIKRKYRGLNGIDFTIYNRRKGCSYYNQFNSYIDAEAIIFNSAKYKLENVMNRKPATNVELIDECDEFLDSFSNVRRINLSRFANALNNVFPDEENLKYVLDKISDAVLDILKDSEIRGAVLDREIFNLKNTKILQILNYLLENSKITNFFDEDSYCCDVFEIAKDFEDFFDDAYVSFSLEERGLIANITTTNLAKKFGELLDKSKAIVLMSGTIHSENVLKKIFGLENFVIIDAETISQGEIEIIETGFEIDCRFENFRNGKINREVYLTALNKAVEKSVKPALIHVNSFDDLPSEQEKAIYCLDNLMTKNKLLEIQGKGSNEDIEKFKKGEIQNFFTTKCSRGVDFPKQQCNSIIFTKYPNPNVAGMFWRILNKTHPAYYWEFYKDKAQREFLQKIYRGVRSHDDHIYILSPDLRVLDNVKSFFN